MSRHPERFQAFVGVGQVANMLEGERISCAWTLEQARKKGDARRTNTDELVADSLRRE